MLGLEQGGSNALRGGKKKFGPKTKCGNWVELNKEPGQALPSGFPHAMFRTDAHQQMLEGVLQRPRRYGAGLPPAEDAHIDYSRVINYDKRQGDSKWAGITCTEFVAPGSCNEKPILQGIPIPEDWRQESLREGHEMGKEFTSSFKLTGGMTDPDQLREYRNSWTVEKDCARSVRFKTDAVTSANTGVPPQFRRTETRKLPGTPKALERLRARALEGGQMGVVRLRQALQRTLEERAAGDTGDGASGRLRQLPVQATDLNEALTGAGLTPLSEFDTTKVIDFFAKHGDEEDRGNSGRASITAIFEGLSSGGLAMAQHWRQAVSRIFREIDEDGSGAIKAGDFKRRYDAADVSLRRARDTKDGAGNYLPVQETQKALLDSFSIYEEPGGDGITPAGFERFVADASCGVTSDAEFKALLEVVVGK